MANEAVDVYSRVMMSHQSMVHDAIELISNNVHDYFRQMQKQSMLLET